MTELEAMERDGLLIRLDYPYRPCRRPFDKAKSKIFDLLSRGKADYRELLGRFASLRPTLEEIPVHQPPGDEVSPYWDNGWLPGLDAISIYGLLALSNPGKFLEVGSGNSTKFARRAIADHKLRTTITSIDPHPRAEIDRICDVVVRQPMEDVGPALFSALTGDDVLFIDNSHRSFSNSDVTVFFTEVLPNLPSGLIYGLHDIFLPWDYPEEWKGRFYNEQHLLSAYLLGGAAGDTILMPNAFVSYFVPYISTESVDLLEPLSEILTSSKLQGISRDGSAMWFRKL